MNVRRRLPIIQGCSVTFLVPILATMALSEWRCPTEEELIAARDPDSGITGPATDQEWTDVWQARMSEVHKCSICALTTTRHAAAVGNHTGDASVTAAQTLVVSAAGAHLMGAAAVACTASAGVRRTDTSGGAPPRSDGLCARWCGLWDAPGYATCFCSNHLCASLKLLILSIYQAITTEISPDYRLKRKCRATGKHELRCNTLGSVLTKRFYARIVRHRKC